MNINTNGFLDKYLEEVKNQAWIKTEEQRLQEALKIPNEKIDAIIEAFGVKDLNNKLNDVLYTKKDNKHITEYYYFRAIVDGIYNIVEDCGWEYCDEILKYAERRNGIKFYSEECFQVSYLDYICSLTPATYLQSEFVDLDFTYLIYRDYDCDLCIKIPEGLNIENTLISIKQYAESYKEESIKQEKDSEYQMYLKLKEKYEGKNK